MSSQQEPEQNVTECDLGCPIHSAMISIRNGIAWFAAAVAATSLYSIPCPYDETFCGVWGCFPPFMALLSMHLLWLVALGAALHAVYGWRRERLIPVGLFLIGISTLATALALGIDLRNWLGNAPSEIGIYWPNRLAYRAITYTDAPLSEGILIGLVAIFLGSRWKRTSKRTADQADTV